MASERLIVANRIKGAKSHGLITTAGRLASSRNRLTREKKLFSTNEPNLRGKL